MTHLRSDVTATESQREDWPSPGPTRAKIGIRERLLAEQERYRRAAEWRRKHRPTFAQAAGNAWPPIPLRDRAA
jgi:hypothetical protein